MCGISGVVDFKKKTTSLQIGSMIKALSHRGPDNTKSMIFDKGNYIIGLSHARLSILDLSEDANQPMQFLNLTIVFNGEIYNFKEIRVELESLGHKFSLNSDTEVILHSFEEWGVSCVKRFIGMFAFVIYDSDDEILYMFRDRAGVKPIFYYMNDDLFLFGSELKALTAHPLFKQTIDKEGVMSYFKYGYIPSPISIYKDTYKLNPGHYAVFSLKDNLLKINKYWDAKDFYEQDQLEINYEQAKTQLHELIKSACQYRMISDVPVGIFLSGGYDSTAVAAILQRHSPAKLKTFTIGFEEGNNEAPFAKDIAAHLNTDHTEYICSFEDVKTLINDLPFHFDEPFADSSALPTMLVSKLSSKEVSVVLSADAGDEIFCGYNSYPVLDNYIKKINILSPFVNQVTLKPIKWFLNLIPDESSLSRKILSVFNVMTVKNIHKISSLHESMQAMSQKIQENLLRDYEKFPSKFLLEETKFKDKLAIGMLIDYKNYLPNDILTKVDRSTMAFSIEGREPFLDHRILEYTARLPLSYKYDGVTKKKILKDIVHEYIPKEMMDRPKTGFSLPIYNWLRSDLSYLLDTYLSNQALLETDLFNVEYVAHLVTLFKRKELHDEVIIWKILQFQMWYRKWMLPNMQ